MMSEGDVGMMVVSFLLSALCMVAGTIGVILFGWGLAALLFVWGGYFVLITVGVVSGSRR